MRSARQGKLLPVEMVIPPDDRPTPAQAMDLNMLVLLGGRERTEEEYQRLFDAAGFRLELQQVAPCGDKPVRTLTHVVVSVDNSSAEAAPTAVRFIRIE